jgi:ribosomal protein S21
MIEIKKNENESTINLIRRFTKKVQVSGILKRVRQLRFRNRPKSELRKKEEAIKKAKTKKRMDYLRKLGKIE